MMSAARNRGNIPLGLGAKRAPKLLHDVRILFVRVRIGLQFFSNQPCVQEFIDRAARELVGIAERVDRGNGFAGLSLAELILGCGPRRIFDRRCVQPGGEPPENPLV